VSSPQLRAAGGGGSSSGRDVKVVRTLLPVKEVVVLAQGRPHAGLVRRGRGQRSLTTNWSLDRGGIENKTRSMAEEAGAKAYGNEDT
jgi:hypothetical protein